MNDRARIGRRRFVRLAAVAAAAAALHPVAATPAAAAKESPKRAPKRRTPDSRVHAEIENQKKQVDAMLQVIRSYELPAGSPPAMVFRPLAPRKRA
jgi:hypothetical protein